MATALITGAGSGIGRATAQQLARRGYRCALVGRRPDALEQTAATLEGAALVLAADISAPPHVQRVVEAAIQQFGQLDAIVHAAGAAPSLSVEQTTLADWRSVLDTNLSAAFYLAKAAWPHFRSRRSGVIVNISSMAARDPFPGFVAYAAAKGGLNLLGLSLAREGAEHGIRVHTIAPAAVETPMLRSLFTPQQLPPEQAMQPAEVARVIADCVTGELANTSGEVIYLHRGA